MTTLSTEAIMPLLLNVIKAMKPAGKDSPVLAPHAHDGDEILLSDAETPIRDVDLAILRALCS
jgi:hypothetical protein